MRILRNTSAVARRDDPDTSWAAAKSVRDISDNQKQIYLALMERGGMTDEALVFLLHDNSAFRRQSPSGIRSRRAELVKLGLVKDSGEKRIGRTGRQMKVWEVN